MAKKKGNKGLEIADTFRGILLYEVYGDNISKKPKFAIPESGMTIAEKGRIYAETVKHAALGLKAEEDEEQPSGMDIIRRQLNGDRTNRSRGDTERAAESGEYPASDAATDTPD